MSKDDIMTLGRYLREALAIEPEGRKDAVDLFNHPWITEEGKKGNRMIRRAWFIIACKGIENWDTRHLLTSWDTGAIQQ